MINELYKRLREVSANRIYPFPHKVEVIMGRSQGPAAISGLLPHPTAQDWMAIVYATNPPFPEEVIKPFANWSFGKGGLTVGVVNGEVAEGAHGVVAMNAMSFPLMHYLELGGFRGQGPWGREGPWYSSYDRTFKDTPQLKNLMVEYHDEMLEYFKGWQEAFFKIGRDLAEEKDVTWLFLSTSEQKQADFKDWHGQTQSTAQGPLGRKYVDTMYDNIAKKNKMGEFEDPYDNKWWVKFMGWPKRRRPKIGPGGQEDGEKKEPSAEELRKYLKSVA